MSAFEENKLSKISRLSNIDLQLFAQRVSFMDPDWCRSLDMRDTGSGGAFKVAAPSRPRFARPRFVRIAAFDRILRLSQAPMHSQADRKGRSA
jgi:hypothetical protein